MVPLCYPCRGGHRPLQFAAPGPRFFLVQRRPAGGAAAEARLRIASDGAVEHFYGRFLRSSRTHRPLLWSAVELHLVELHGMPSHHPCRGGHRALQPAAPGGNSCFRPGQALVIPGNSRRIVFLFLLCTPSNNTIGVE